jgi:hypothetical protein
LQEDIDVRFAPQQDLDFDLVRLRSHAHPEIGGAFGPKVVGSVDRTRSKKQDGFGVASKAGEKAQAYTFLGLREHPLVQGCPRIGDTCDRVLRRAGKPGVVG